MIDSSLLSINWMRLRLAERLLRARRLFTLQAVIDGSSRSVLKVSGGPNATGRI
jgi:hypothetical protein